MNSWDESEVFLPERFLGEHMETTGDNFSLLPFGSGRRMCPAYKLGLKIFQTTLANLWHGFELHLDEGTRAEDICMEENFGLTTNLKHPLSIVMIDERASIHLKLSLEICYCVTLSLIFVDASVIEV